MPSGSLFACRFAEALDSVDEGPGLCPPRQILKDGTFLCSRLGPGLPGPNAHEQQTAQVVSSLPCQLPGVCSPVDRTVDDIQSLLQVLLDPGLQECAHDLAALCAQHQPYVVSGDSPRCG